MTTLIRRRLGWCGLFATVLAAGCGPHGMDEAAQVSSPPIPSGHTLEGVLFDAYSGPIANRWISVLAVLDNGGVAGFNGRPVSDGQGRFKLSGLPDSKVFLLGARYDDYTWAGDYYNNSYFQPCGVSLDLRGDVERNIEIVAAETLNSLAAPRPLSAREPTYTGTVFEKTPTGRRPVAGAVIEVVQEYKSRYETRASTMTDLSGHYFLCDLAPLPPEDTWFRVFVDDELVTTLWSVDVSQSMTLDIEFERP